MQWYHHIIKEEKLLPSKKAMSLLQRYWKGVIPSESCSLTASGANCRYARMQSPLTWGLAHKICSAVICWSSTSVSRSIPCSWQQTAILWGVTRVLEQAWWHGNITYRCLNHSCTASLVIHLPPNWRWMWSIVDHTHRWPQIADIYICNWFWYIKESQWFAVSEGPSINVCDGGRKIDCFYWFAPIENQCPNAFEVTRPSDESQGMTTFESFRFNIRDVVRHCNLYQGFTMSESPSLDGVNGRSKYDFRNIFRGAFTFETLIGVESRRAVWGFLWWHVSM